MVIEIGTLISAIGAIVTIIVGIVIYWRQSNTQIFFEYTKRYDEIMESFPHEARVARLTYKGGLPDQSEELSVAILRYLNLCSEEYYLYKKGYLAKDLWGIWEDELKHTLKNPLFVREWKTLRTQYISYPEFIKFVENAQQ